MIRATILSLLLCAGAAQAQSVTEQAVAASAALSAAISGMEGAESGRDQVATLTQTIHAYELGMGAMRDGLRQAKVREAALLLQFDAERSRVGQLLGVLSQMEATPGPLLLLHPGGPLGTVRSGMIVSEVTPALQAQVVKLQGELTELQQLRTLQAAAGDVLKRGLTVAQTARTALSQAISDRTTLPRKFTEDPEALRTLLESADTLAAFANSLTLDTRDGDALRSFASAEGKLALPTLGTLLSRAGEADASGTKRPGITLATRPRALVTAPWAGTIRYRGPLLDYGNVMILEPGGGYLLVLAGLGTVYGEVGEVVGLGAPLGLMGGGDDENGKEFLASVADVGGIRETETLYIEIRKGTEPVDPAPWFAATKD
ncbi:murein hydrolase activator EnvC [Pseudorhodobacter sp.]|uniref:murein hydrolase activator EnvC family protein n=1 Tax=Pseudorhodobacter sp. TaxID=1934400 RepID=UPI00264A3E21|nr:peptidoglycan DD-metalloendopeptidase family protein [Pseudorhodobacter sp.]MDN5788352.1 peptidoglycan DD-metalloendopeptidase family protein [Pseudorhodobacter sp.]